MIVRVMRNSPILDALFPRIRQQILAVALLQTDHAWYLLELSRHLGVRPSSLQRELKALMEAGILKQKQEGGRVYYQADVNCPIFHDLAQILFKTAGIAHALSAAFKPFQNRISVAFIFGSVAISAERSASDVDLIVVGFAQLSEIASILRDVEKALGRPVNPHMYSPSEFVERLGHGDHFLSAVLQEQRLFIIGDENDLAKLTASTEAKAAPHQPSRDRGPKKPR
jgi:DNA-binding transcriptional ArsR family regulator